MIDEHNESRDIYAAEHSKLIDPLGRKFDELQLKLKPLLKEAKTYTSTSKASTTSTSSSTPTVYENIYGESNEEIIYEDDPHSILREFAIHDI